MSSKKSNTSNISWESPLLELAGKAAPSKSMLKLRDAGHEKVKDLLWILPLRVQPAPKPAPFSEMREGRLFMGSGRILGSRFSPAYGRRGKRGVQLFNATLTVQDSRSERLADLKFFNTYPNFKKSVEDKETISFMGKVSIYRGSAQLANPQIDPKEIADDNGLLVEYPTVASVSGRLIKGVINKIPEHLWKQTPASFGGGVQLPLAHSDLSKAFALLHGKAAGGEEERKKAKEDLVYHEFFVDRLKVMARRAKIKTRDAPVINWPEDFARALIEGFPYTLTADQQAVLDQIREDFLSGRPMMRMIQGDVGCGKTTVAFVAAMIAVRNQGQCALMCPTESLALQHYETFKELLPRNIRLQLLLGSHKPSEKRSVQQALALGEADIVIGTHSLIQKSARFKNLQFAIIDEQHKFGVEQRLKLSAKGDGVHTLIMTATPIPRTLQLAQYGDLDISTIRTMPKGRAGIKTRIVSGENYEKYLSFLKTRLSMGEQAYIVAPAIEESEVLDIKNVQEIESRYKRYFPEFKIRALHGRLSAAEKKQIFLDFAGQKIDALISTSVVEVGINVANATVMSVYNPERFGLSSLHQLRGRVGRGQKPGFCFLVAGEKARGETLARLKVIERSNDGFEIAEADLKNRGEGDLFGTEQSGSVGQRKLASVFEHFDIFDRVNADFDRIALEQKSEIEAALAALAGDQKVSSTI